MPYIKQEDRKSIDKFINHLEGRLLTYGELNYLITKLIHRQLSFTERSYKTFNAYIGVLECAKQELYRQVVAPYEDRKKAENGPVSELDD